MIRLPGGFQPRAAVGYSLVVALEVAALSGAGEGLHSEIDVAAARTEELIASWGPGGALWRAFDGLWPRWAFWRAFPG